MPAGIIRKKEGSKRVCFENKIAEAVISGIKTLYGQEVPAQTVQLQKTKQEFTGHLTLVVFPFLKISHKKPEETAQEIGNYLKAEIPHVVSGFIPMNKDQITIEEKKISKFKAGAELTEAIQ